MLHTADNSQEEFILFKADLKRTLKSAQTFVQLSDIFIEFISCK